MLPVYRVILSWDWCLTQRFKIMKNIFQPVTLIRDIEDQTVLTEEDAVFECEIKINYPEIRLTWYKGTERLLSNKKYEIKIEGDRHILKIRNCQLGDQANYRVVCGPHIASAKLHVIGKCKILIDPIFKII